MLGPVSRSFHPGRIVVLADAYHARAGFSKVSTAFRAMIESGPEILTYFQLDLTYPMLDHRNTPQNILY